jgi:hypothetical protein
MDLSPASYREGPAVETAEALGVNCGELVKLHHRAKTLPK